MTENSLFTYYPTSVTRFKRSCNYHCALLLGKRRSKLLWSSHNVPSLFCSLLNNKRVPWKDCSMARSSSQEWIAVTLWCLLGNLSEPPLRRVQGIFDVSKLKEFYLEQTTLHLIKCLWQPGKNATPAFKFYCIQSGASLIGFTSDQWTGRIFPKRNVNVKPALNFQIK